MEFVRILLASSNVKESKIVNAAKKASENPTIGITIQNQAAYHVIKDCANITLQYLPAFVFGALEKPFETLNGKFKREHIVELLEHSKKSYPVEHLVSIILAKAEKQIPSFNTTTLSSSSPNTKFDPTDPYGDYDVHIEDSKPQTIKLSTEELLCKAFNA